MPTYRRPAELRALLPRLAEQADALTASSTCTVEVLVVDNDAEGSAARTVRETVPQARYVVEPQPGVSAVRNRALEESPGSDLLVFIDDDELPGPGWLAALVSAWQEWRCAAVTGPVLASLARRPRSGPARRGRRRARG